MLEGSEAFDNFENDILPRENEDGITEYASIKISLDFVETRIGGRVKSLLIFSRLQSSIPKVKPLPLKTATIMKSLD
jgi:hypothetical protein